MNKYKKPSRADQWLERAAWPLAIVVTAVFLTCLQFIVTAPFEFFSFDKMANFQAPEPFQHRVLMPAIVAALGQVVPASNTLLFGVLQWIGWIALIWLAYRALVVFGVGRSDLIRRVLAFSIIVPMLLDLAVPYLYMPQTFIVGANGLGLGNWSPVHAFYYVYDLPAAIFTLALVLLLVRQYERFSWPGIIAYLVLFALATANRETSVFLICFSALLFWNRLSLRSWLGLILLQMMVFVAVELPLQWLFRSHVNPSPNVGFNSQYENHLFENLGLFLNPLFLMIMLARFMAGLYLPVLLWRRFLDRPMGCALVGFVLPLLGCALIVGRLQEHRIFIEAVPLVWLAAMQVITLRSAESVSA